MVMTLHQPDGRVGPRCSFCFKLRAQHHDGKQRQIVSGEAGHAEGGEWVEQPHICNACVAEAVKLLGHELSQGLGRPSD